MAERLEVGRFARGVCGLAAWLVISPIGASAEAVPASAAPAGVALVAVDFLADGRCHVSAEGQGFRSNATYRPQATAEPGALRCAMPPVQPGLTVALTVTVPPGAARPGDSEPALAWKTAADGHWTGTANLTEWPDAIAVAADRPWLSWTSLGLPLGLLATLAIPAAVVMRRRRGGRVDAA